ncbi:MAG: helix-turn-helix domain-containing protein [Propionicimonas sp.]
MPEVVAYTVTTAAKAVGKSKSTIERAIKAGDLPCSHPVINGREVRGALIDPAELRRWALGAP